MAMSKEHKERLIEGVVVAVLAALILWVLFNAFRGAPGGSSSSTGPTINEADPNASPYSFPGLGGGGCGCNDGCPVSASTIPTLNTMLAQGAAATNQILGMGTATLQALADMGNEEDPLLKVTVG